MSGPRRVGQAQERQPRHDPIETLTRKLAPQLLDQPGVGPHAAAQLVLSGSHHGRIESEAAFARLAGAASIPPLPAAAATQAYLPRKPCDISDET
jgi:hypothetical protein